VGEGRIEAIVEAGRSEEEEEEAEEKKNRPEELAFGCCSAANPLARIIVAACPAKFRNGKSRRASQLAALLNLPKDFRASPERASRRPL
jgi:hypothetical protein